MVISRMLPGVLLLVAASVYAGENRGDALDWLKVVVVAERQTDYSGVFVYQYDNYVETTRITHVTAGKGDYELLESLDGPKREIIRHHEDAWEHHGHGMVEVDSQSARGRFPALLPEQLAVLKENYIASFQEIERVAGYNAQVILFHPKDNLRYTHKIWVHTGSGLLLKAAVLAGKDRVVEQYAFTQLQVGGKIDRSWINRSAPAQGSVFHRLHEGSKTGMPVKSGWVADAMPAGFRKTLEIQRSMHGNHAPVTQIVFSDGLSAISIFIEHEDGDEDDFEGLSSRGAVNVYHKVVGKHLFTVVGEVPPRTVMRVLESIRRSSKS